MRQTKYEQRLEVASNNYNNNDNNSNSISNNHSALRDGPLSPSAGIQLDCKTPHLSVEFLQKSRTASTQSQISRPLT